MEASVLSTYASYQMISRDIGKSIERVQSRPMVQRESEYYLENIDKVKSIEDFWFGVVKLPPE